jgi:hypothetical protein
MALSTTSPYGSRRIGQGDFAYGTGANARQIMLGKHSGGADLSASPVGQNWLKQNQAMADSNMASSGGTGNVGGMQPMRPPQANFNNSGMQNANPMQQRGPISTPQAGMNINTSIQPKPIYEPWMTQRGMNQIGADAAQASNLPYLMKQFDRPGMSRSEGSLGLAGPMAANMQANAGIDQGNLMMDDMFANQKQMLAGEIARGQEGRSLGGLSLALQEMQDRFLNNQLGRAFSFLG